MFYVKETYPDVFERIISDVVVGEGEDAITHPLGNLALYSADELAALGVIPVEFARLPLGHYEIARRIERIDGVVTEIIDNAPSPIVVPQSVTNAQAKIALVDAGLYQQVVAAVNAGDIRLGIWFANAQVWERSNFYVAALGQGLGLDEAEIDTLFVAAAAIK